MLVCDVTIASTISCMLRTVAAVVNIMQNVCCWSWALSTLVLHMKAVESFIEAIQWCTLKHNSVEVQKNSNYEMCKSRFCPKLAKIRINKSGKTEDLHKKGDHVWPTNPLPKLHQNTHHSWLSLMFLRVPTFSAVPCPPHNPKSTTKHRLLK